MLQHHQAADNCWVSLQGVIKLIDAAKQAGVRKFVLQTSILTNGKAINEGLNPIFLVLNAVTGALDKKLEVNAPPSEDRPVRGPGSCSFLPTKALCTKYALVAKKVVIYIWQHNKLLSCSLRST